MTTIPENTFLKKSQIRTAASDPGKSAAAVNLIYVQSKHMCIERKGEPGSFYYVEDSKRIKDKSAIERIKKLVIPPAWTNVRICKLNNGHLQATGNDKLGRKQYRYHSLWNSVRNQTKFYRLLDFGKQLPVIRKRVENDLGLQGYPREKILAAVISLMERTHIRIGNMSYEKLYGSFGLTTLKNKHVSLTGSSIRFSFTGKKGIKHDLTLQSRKLSRIVRACKEIPGKDLFEYIGVDGEVHKIDSGMVNSYMKEISGGDFTAKDFRTWAGSVSALINFKAAGGFENETDMKQKVNSVIEKVALELGNTKAVCRKYYVHSVILKLYEEKKLDEYLKNMKDSELDDDQTSLTSAEKTLLKILEDN